MRDGVSIVKILRIVYIVIALSLAILCYRDYAAHAQAPDPYSNAEKTAANSAIIDQIQIHDAETNHKFDDVNSRIDQLNTRVSFAEGGIAGFGALLGLIQVGILVIPRIEVLKGSE